MFSRVSCSLASVDSPPEVLVLDDFLGSTLNASSLVSPPSSGCNCSSMPGVASSLAGPLPMRNAKPTLVDSSVCVTPSVLVTIPINPAKV
ncbi:hypothetical protein KC351_g108 [Hortaea werneckii]|nr:hypothetical protein KC351_g108 [Hortaea werneckii]